MSERVFVVVFFCCFFFDEAMKNERRKNRSVINQRSKINCPTSRSKPVLQTNLIINQKQRSVTQNTLRKDGFHCLVPLPQIDECSGWELGSLDD